MEVTINKEQFTDLFQIAEQIVKFGKGEINSLDLRDIQTAMSELRRAERACEEIDQPVSLFESIAELTRPTLYQSAS